MLQNMWCVTGKKGCQLTEEVPQEKKSQLTAKSIAGAALTGCGNGRAGTEESEYGECVLQKHF